MNERTNEQMKQVTGLSPAEQMQQMASHSFHQSVPISPKATYPAYQDPRRLKKVGAYVKVSVLDK